MTYQFAITLVLLTAAATAHASVTVSGSKAQFKSDRMIVEIEDGEITRVFNRLTGTDYIRKPARTPGDEVSTGIVYAESSVSTGEQTGVVGPTVTKAGTQVLKPTLLGLKSLTRRKLQKIGDAEVEATFSTADSTSELRISYAMGPDGDLIVTQKASGSRRGLAAVRWGLSTVQVRGDLLLPALGGIKAAPKAAMYQYESRSWQWPTGWMLPLLIVQDPVGGMWIHARDPKRRFKSVKFEDQDKAAWGIAVESENFAPFPPHSSIEGAEWRLGVYSGDWKVPVRAYREWSYAANAMGAKSTARPGWLSDIRLVVKHADHLPEQDIAAYLDSLKAITDPKKTLLFNTNWIDGSKGMIMPHWVVSEKGRRFNREARKRGFRTMYFANYIGITPNHPRFPDFTPYVIRGAYSGELEGWNLKKEWTAVSQDVQLYYVSPAHKPWRDFQVSSFKALLKDEPADGLFIDQAFLMFNDANGMRAGESTIDGNLAYHKALSEALPGVAIGGESINEVTMQYESIWEHHPLSLSVDPDPNASDGSWKLSPDAFPRMVPILPFYLEPHVRMIGYLGFPTTKQPGYSGWRDALHLYGGIPTVSKPTMAELSDPESEVRRAIKSAMAGR